MTRSPLHTLLSLLCALTLLPACYALNGDPEPEDFDRTCALDSDCVVVMLSSRCGCPQLTVVSAGEVDAVERRNAQVEEDRDRCETLPTCLEQPPAQAICNVDTTQCILTR